MDSKAQEALIQQLQELSIQQERELVNIIKKQKRERKHLVRRLTQESNARYKEQTKRGTGLIEIPPANHHHIDTSKVPLHIGDRVTLLTSGATGRVGDKARIIKFNKTLLLFKFEDGTTTVGPRKNLVCKN